MVKNYFFFKITILLGLFFGLMSANAQNLKIEQTQLTTGWNRTVATGETVSFPAAAKSASSFSFTIRNTGGTAINLTGTPIVQISGTNAAEFTCTQPSVTTLNAGESTTFTVTYLPVGLGVRTALMTVPSNDPISPFQINLKGASFDLYGAKSSVPDGSANVVATDGSNGKFGRVGGGNIYINAVTFSSETNLYWGPNLSTDGDLGIKVSMDDAGIYQGNETLTFDTVNSNLSIGKVVWQGSTRIQNAISGTFVSVLVRATMTASWYNTTTGVFSPIPLIDPVSLGLSSQIGGLVQFDDFTDYLRANILIEASTNGGATWTPYLNFYDAYPTPPGPLPGAGIGSAYSSFSQGYYWDNLDPQLTTNNILTVSEGSSAVITTAKLNAKDLEDITLAYGNKSNIVFKVITNNNGLATGFGNGDLKLDGVNLAENSTFTLQNIEDGKLTYTHNGSETIYDEFLFSFVDSKKELGDDAGHTTYNFKINVTAVNDQPVANNLTLTSSYAAPLTGTLTVSDPDSTIFTYSIVSNPTSGTISNFNATTGTFTYTPTLGAPGSDSFMYEVSDGSLTSTVATVSITLINLAPTSQNESLVTTEDTVLTGQLTGTDPEGTTTSFQIDTQPNHGTIVLNNSTGNFTYTPNLSRIGYDSFLFSVKDQQNNASVSYKATINIIPRIDPGDVLVVDEKVIRLYDPVTVQDTIITKNQGLQDGINLVYKKNVGLFAFDKNTGLIKIDPLTGVQSLVSAKSNFSSAGPIGGPSGMLISSNNKILIANDDDILEVDPVTGVINNLFPNGIFGFPTGIVYISNGDLLVTDASKILGGSSKLIRIAPDGTQSIVTTGGIMNLPLDLAVIDNNTVVISDAGSFAGLTDNIYKVDLTTGVQTVLSSGGNIGAPSGLDVWNDKVYVVNKGSKKVLELDGTTGTQSVIAGSAITNPWGLFVVQNSLTVGNLLCNEVSCLNEEDGKINFTISGGTAPYFYSLDGGTEVQITSLPVTITDLKAKSYSLTVRDSMSDNVTINALVNTLPDTQDPTITAPVAVNVSTDAGSCVASGVALGNPIASDNCTGYVVTNDAPTSFVIGATVVHWTVTDSSGNTATANQTITVVDNQNPMITAPAAINVVADAGSCIASGVTLGTAVASDNCTGYVITNDAPTSFVIGTTIVKWTVTDASGNIAIANQTVIVADTQNPVITAPIAVTTNTDTGKCTASGVNLGMPIVTDNCTSYTVSNDAPAVFQQGQTIVVWTVTDASGNIATASQTVTVTGISAPSIQISQSLCEGSLVSDINTNGLTIRWYSDVGGTIVIPNTISLNSGTYYAASFNGNCESTTRTAVTITINSALPPTGQVNQAFCDGVTLNDLAVSGNNITWYGSKTSSTALPLSTVLNNQIKYYASQKDNVTGCESQRLEVMVTVNKASTPQGVSEYTFCNGVNPTLASISKDFSNVEWYDNVSQNNRLAEDHTLTNEEVLYGYAYDANTGCKSIDYHSISVRVLDCNLEIFNYLTPNNNNQNEALVITNIEAFPKNKLQVFNRQGQMVYEVSAYGQNNSSFRGYSNTNGSSKKLPTGTYFYVLEYLSSITGKNENKKGFLYINNND